MKDDNETAGAIAEKFDAIDPSFINDLNEKYHLDAYGLYPRLMRAVGNQTTEGTATFSRYALFANDLVRYIDIANKIIEQGEKEDAVRILERTRNAIAAFSEIQIIKSNVLREI